MPGPRALPRSHPAVASHSSLRTRSPAPCTHLSSMGGGHDQLISTQSLRDVRIEGLPLLLRILL